MGTRTQDHGGLLQQLVVSRIVPQVSYAWKVERAGGTDHDAVELDRDGRLEVGSDLYPCETGSRSKK